MIETVPRFGDNIRAIRKSLKLNQKELAAHLWNDDGTPMQQANISKLEGMEWAPRPDTVERLAAGLSRVSGLTPQAEVERLMAGVSSRYDAALHLRAAQADPLDRLRRLIAQLPPEQRADVYDAIERVATTLPENRHSDLLDAVKHEAAKAKPRSARKKA